MLQSSPERPTGYRSVAAVVQSTCKLPAVATLDWADRAAGTLSLIATPSRACIVLCSIDQSGAVRSHEATGVASSVSASNPRPENHGDRNPELTLRSRGERLDHIGFRLNEQQLREGVCDTLDRLLGTAEWRSLGLGRLWAGVPAGEVFTAISELGGVVSGRAIVAMVGMSSSESDAVRQDRISQLRAVMPCLIGRALLAVGAEIAGSGRWLTAREQQVLAQLTLGKSVRQIAEDIGRSPHTVHDHVKSLHRKLNASSRGELVARALGYLNDEDTSDMHRKTPDASAPLTELKSRANELERPRAEVRPTGGAYIGIPDRERATSERA